MGLGGVEAEGACDIKHAPVVADKHLWPHTNAR